MYNITISLLLITFDMYLIALQYDNTLFSFTLFSCLKSSFNFTQYVSTLILHKHSIETFYNSKSIWYICLYHETKYAKTSV